MTTIRYWDYSSTTGTTTSTSATSNVFYWNCGTTSTTDYYCPPRRILVKCPEHWTEDVLAAHVRLINDETNTGWKVTMVIRGGEILITDPSVEVRSMADFVPLLKQHASTEDRERIDKFFAEHGDA